MGRDRERIVFDYGIGQVRSKMTPTSEKNKNYPLIPEEEKKCIWMTTGLVSYKLCERSYLCESCPFDQAIKNEERGEYDFQEAEDDLTEGALKRDSYDRIGASAFYHPDHCWVKVNNAESVRIGIDDLLAQLISDVRVVILPQMGSVIKQGECCAHIIQEDYIVPVVSPLSGLIQTLNHRLREEPKLIIDDPRENGWLMTIKPQDLESDLKNLLFGRKALLWYQKEEREIIAQTDLILNNNPEAVGFTMQDGGVKICGLHDRLNMANAKQKTQILDLSIIRSKINKKLMAKPTG
jgi:glycine cleavage system H protein